MKILHIVFSFKYGGIETMLVNIVNEQIKYAHVSIIIINDNYEQTLIDRMNNQVKIIKVNRPLKSKNPYYIAKLNFLILKISPDIIHSHNSSIIKYILPKFRDKAVNTIHDTPNSSHFPYIHSYKKIFAISKSVQKDLKKHGYESLVIQNGIQTTKFKKRSHQHVSSTFKIVQIGRLEHYKKGQDILIKACSLLIKKESFPIHIDIIGEGSSMEYLIELVKKANLDSYITFLGSKDTNYIEQHLKDYNLLVQPSRIEGFGLTVTEAMAAKVPVLVSGHEGPMEIIDNGKYGFFFINENVHELADKIKEIINMKQQILEYITEKAIQRVNSHYNIERTAYNYIKHYIDLCK